MKFGPAGNFIAAAKAGDLHKVRYTDQHMVTGLGNSMLRS